jgi:protein ImuB
MTEAVRTLALWCTACPAGSEHGQLVSSLEQVAPRWEVLGPQWCAVPVRGPSRYFGGDAAVAQQVAELVLAHLAEKPPPGDDSASPVVRVGVADGLFAAKLAARLARPDPDPDLDRGPGQGAAAVKVVPPGGSPELLAPLPLRTLERPELVSLLRRLGLRSLGDLAALPASKVLGRFGAEGMAAQRLARGLDERLPAPSPPPEDLTVSAELDPPEERVEAAAFVARSMAEDLHLRLAERGSACTRLLVGAETTHGESHERVWRTEGTFGATTVAERVRWQLQGWVDSGATRPTGGICRLWLVPEEIVPAGGRQLAFGTVAGVDAAAAERSARAIARLQGLLGEEKVLVPERRGGRGPAEQVALVPAGTVELAGPRPAARPDWVGEPWPGAVPPPTPAVVFAKPEPVDVQDEAGRRLMVSGRGVLSARPGHVDGRKVVAWSAPWPSVERWWDRLQHRRRVRLQVLLADGTAHLLILERGRWSLEATYD